MEIEALLKQLLSEGHEIGDGRGMTPDGKILYEVDRKMFSVPQMKDLLDPGSLKEYNIPDHMKATWKEETTFEPEAGTDESILYTQSGRRPRLDEVDQEPE